jgi:Flp pilus assembly pilin Flp
MGLLLYGKAFLGAHFYKLRESMRDGDRGASAVELALITAVLVLAAILIGGIVYTFVNDQSKNVSKDNNYVPGGN